MPVREPQAGVSIERLPATEVGSVSPVTLYLVRDGAGRFRFASAAGDGASAGLEADPAAGNRLRVLMPTSSTATRPLYLGGRVLL